MLRQRLMSTIASALALTASAVAQTHASRPQVINAGVVILESSRANAVAEPVTAAPHVWFNLDRNRSVKPASWTFQNPHANTVLNEPLFARWSSIQTSLGLAVPEQGVRLSKRTAAYWEVRLDDITDAELGDYDVLSVAPLYRAQLSPIEREKLRRFVDRGGVLWIDPSGLSPSTGLDIGNSFPIPFNLVGGSSAIEFRDLTHPLLRAPLSLSIRDLSLLSVGPTGTASNRDFVAPLPASAGDAAGVLGETFADFYRIQPVTYQSVTPGAQQYSIGVARIGDGFVVLTGHAVALKLNRVRTQNTDGTPNYGFDQNWGFIGRDPNLEGDGLAAAKLAVNMISLTREASQPQGGSQKNSSTPIDIGAPLIRRASDTTIGGTNTAPVLYKGLLVVTAGDAVRVYDADPARDIDGDSDPNDGLQTEGGATGRDLIWESTVAPNLSAPVCTEVPNSVLTRADGSRITDLVLVVDGTGRLHALDLFAYDASGRLSGAPRASIGGGLAAPGSATSTPPATGMFASQTLAPVVHEGIAYIVDQTSGNTQGRLWMVSIAEMARIASPAGRDWYIGAGALNLAPPSAPATVGYIPIFDNSGGVDRVLYMPTARVTSLGGSTPAGFVSLWLGAKGEKPTSYEVVGSNLRVTTRAALLDTGVGLPIYLPNNPLNPFGPRLSLLRADGSVYSTAELATVLNGAPTQSAGVLEFPLGTGLPADVTGVRVDYAIDYGFGTGPELANVVRGSVQLPDVQNAPTRDIMGSLALGPRGTVFFNAAPSVSPTAMTIPANMRAGFFAYREEGRGSFRCLIRYELFGQHTMAGGTLTQTVAPVLADGDPVVNFAPAFLNQPFNRFTFLGPPAVQGDTVYAVAWGGKGLLGVSTSVILAFAAEPEEPSIYIENFPTGSTIVQPDLARSTFAARPEVQASFNPGQMSGMTYDPDSRLLKINSLANLQRPNNPSVLSLSQPIFIRRPDGSFDYLEPNSRDGNRFSPLLWFTVLNGYKPTPAGIALTGDTLFASGSSLVRNLLTAGTFDTEGLMYAMDVNVSPNDPFVQPMPGRPWVSQLWQLRGSGSNLEGNPAQKWPQVTGVQDFDDYLVRLNQTVVPDSDTLLGMAAGEGTLAVVADNGLHTYSRSDFVVADQGRVATFDPAGNPNLVLSSTAQTGKDPAGNAGTLARVVNPVRAYPQSDGTLLVVDAGANRVFVVDRAGIELRSIDRIALDPAVRPTSLPANPAIRLSNPRDVVTYESIESAATVAQFFTPSGNSYEYWVHYLIADSGNDRLIEVVDRYAYDPASRRIGNIVRLNNVPQEAVALWHSPTTVTGKGYAYNSVSRVSVNGRFVYFAGIGGALPSAVDTGRTDPAAAGGALRGTAGFGGVAIFDPLLPNGVLTFNSITVPAVGADVFYNDATASFSSAARAAQVTPLTGVNSVTATAVPPSGSLPQGGVLVMITDSRGVHEVLYDPNLAVDGSGNANATYAPEVVWQLPNEVYRVMRRSGAGNGQPIATNPAQLRATYARRVESGEVLVVNGYLGQTRGIQNPDGTFSGRQPFRGEVIQVSGALGRFNDVNMGFGLRSITFNLELVGDTRGLVLPVFADRR